MIATMTCEKPPWEVPQPMNVYPVTTENVTGETPDSPSAILSDTSTPVGKFVDLQRQNGPAAVLKWVGDPTGVIKVIEGLPF